MRHTGKVTLIATLLAAVGLVSACQSTKEQERAESPADKTAEAQSSEESTSAAEASSDEKGGHEADQKQDHDHKHEREHGFEHPERYAERWNDPARDDWQKPKEVIELMGVEPGMTVADLGTGTGYFLPHLSEAVGPEGKVWALDVSEKMLTYVRDKTFQGLPHQNVETKRVERDDPKLDAESVDSIVMVNTWHHVTNRTAYAEKLLAALKPGGTFVDVDYTKASGEGPPKKIKLDPEEVVEELEAAGFEATVADESLPKQYVVVGTKPAGGDE